MACYYPNGQQSDSLKPCNGTAAVSHCCRKEDVCITNGFCFSPGLNSVVRRGCTDRTFNATECPKQCLIGDNFRSADVVMIPCDSYTTFCCGQDQAARNCCSTGNGTVRIIAGSAMLSFNNIFSPTITINSTITATASSSTCASTAPAITASSGDCGTEKTATIGVGAGLGVALLLVAAFLTYLWRKAERRIIELEMPFVTELPERSNGLSPRSHSGAPP